MEGTGSIRRRRGRRAGFSWVELLACVAVTATLAALALPGFHAAWLHARRSAAVAALLRLQLAEERFFVEHSRYATDLGELYAATGAALAPDHYQLAAASAGAEQYRLEATAVGAQTGDRPDCLQLAVNQRGERSPPEPSGCWR